MLLRNGLCNGTRLIVTNVTPRLLTARICTGAHVGRIVTIPRIDVYSAPNTLPFTLRRRQFPVQLAFSVTINKSHGQTLNRVGLYLPNPVFTHGQYYVEISRCGDWQSTKIFIKPSPEGQGIVEGVHFTKSIVFRALLN